MQNNISPFDLDEKSTQSVPFASKYGIFAGLGMIISFMVLVITNLHYQQWASWITVFVGASIALFGAAQFKKTIDPQQFATFGQCFKTAFIIYFIGAILSFLFYLVYINLIDDSYMTNLMQSSEEKMKEKGLSAAQIEQAIKYTKQFMSPMFMSLIQVVFGIVLSSIVGLIAGFAFKRID